MLSDVAFKIFIWVCSRVPLGVAWLFSWTLAWLWWTVIPIRKVTAVGGFHTVFPDLPVGPNLRREVAELVMGYFELFREARKPCIRLAIENPELILDQLATGKGAILVAGHFGSWDLVGPMIGRDLSLPVTVVVKNPKWKPAADCIEGLRHTFGLGLLPTADCFDSIIEEMAGGRLLVFLLDQRYWRGIPVEFFGRPAWTTPAVAIAAERNNVPVYGLCYWREGIGEHRARFSGPLPMVGDTKADTETIQRYYEETIRERPYSWLWLHDRWKKPHR